MLFSLSLNPGTVDSDFIQIKYPKDQANDKDYSHEGLGFSFKKWPADNVAKNMDSKEVEAFAADKKSGQGKFADLWQWHRRCTYEGYVNNPRAFVYPRVLGKYDISLYSRVLLEEEHPVWPRTAALWRIL